MNLGLIHKFHRQFLLLNGNGSDHPRSQMPISRPDTDWRWYLANKKAANNRFFVYI